MMRRKKKKTYKVLKYAIGLLILLFCITIVLIVGKLNKVDSVHYLRHWSIYSSKPIKEDELSTLGINVYDNKGHAVNVKITLGDFGKSILVLPPDNGYTQGETYTLKAGKSSDCTIEKNRKSIKSLKFKIITEAKDELTINFKDKNFEAAVRTLIKKPTGEIIVKDVKNITYFVSTFNNIKDISGIEYFTNLGTLSLDGNQIESISDLKNLTDLSHLGISHNNIKDISSLKDLKNLKILFLANNKITDYSILKGIYKNLEIKDFKIK